MNDVTVILTFYKRPHVIHEQINSIKKQTIPPKNIIIWINQAIGYKFPDDLRKDESLIIIDSNHNFGVWARFALGLIANTEFIAVFDDDTIPGKKWLENCINTINNFNGLLGTIGIIFKNRLNYTEWICRKGWDNPNEKTEQVDIVGHAWFFRREWIHHLFKFTPDYNLFLTMGEDICFSWALQKVGINTYVPPHPLNDLEMYGSKPSLALKYGTEAVAISNQKDAVKDFNKIYSIFIENGFKLITD